MARALNTFLFADIAGYTALTEAHGDEEAAELAAGFRRAVAERLPTGSGDVVRTIGDAVMLRIDDPAVAILLGLEITQDLMAEHGSPAVRVGMDRGEAVERNGDWFGTTVNVAARIAGLAAGGEVLLTAAVREAAGEVEGVRFESDGEQRLRNVAKPIAIFAALRGQSAARATEVDPVCRMILEPGREAGRLTDETEYRFCSLECAGRFAADPEAYVRG